MHRVVVPGRQGRGGGGLVACRTAPEPAFIFLWSNNILNLLVLELDKGHGKLPWLAQGKGWGAGAPAHWA